MNKRGVSQVITTILLIALVIIAVAVIGGIIMTFLGSGDLDKKDCISARFEIADDNVVCYRDGTVKLTVERGSDNLDQIGLRFISGSNSADLGNADMPIPQGKKEITTGAIGTIDVLNTVRMIPLVGKNTDVACEVLEEIDVVCDSCKADTQCDGTNPTTASSDGTTCCLTDVGCTIGAGGTAAYKTCYTP